MLAGSEFWRARVQMLPSTPGPPGVSGLSSFVSLCSRTGHGTHTGTYKAWSLVFFLCLHFLVLAMYCEWQPPSASRETEHEGSRLRHWKRSKWVNVQWGLPDSVDLDLQRLR